jgi:hypothetical protein
MEDVAGRWLGSDRGRVRGADGRGGLAVPFTYSEGGTDPDGQGLFPVRYVVPGALRAEQACGATVVTLA